jgi:hypothetical protein
MGNIPSDPFGLRRLDKAFCFRLIPHVYWQPYRAIDAVIGKEALESSPIVPGINSERVSPIQGSGLALLRLIPRESCV